MSLILLAISTVQLVNIVLVIVALLLAFKYAESFWSYRINKPFAWEQAVKNNLISKKLIRIERLYRDKVRFYNLWFQVERLKKNKVIGAFAEIGVHKGKTAKAIHHMDQERLFYLFDTFEGFPERDLAKENQSDERFSESMFADTSVEEVRKYIGDNDKLIFKPGLFPETAAGLENEEFSLVNIDADLYIPTIEALRFFYPRLVEGGVIIVHDYNHNWEGVPKALDEFMLTIPESLVELPDWQGSALIVKTLIRMKS